MKKISFCITCKNRFYQISKTLPVNLKQNEAHQDSIEFILVDLGSEDGLQEWVLSNFADALDKGYLKYFYTNALKSWHAPIAKNTSHYYATGEYLVNLDCDNFTGLNGGYYVYNQFLNHGPKLLLHQFNGDWLSGCYGRIGMSRKYFSYVGGYDESLEPMGHEDVDLINRLSELGLNYRRIGDSRYTGAIKNTREESVQYSNSHLRWYQMETRNAKKSRSNLFSGKIISNDGSFGIRKDVYTYTGGKIIIHESLNNEILTENLFLSKPE